MNEKRIKISRIQSHDSGHAAGRIISIDDKKIFLSDDSGEACFVNEINYDGIKEGDLAFIYFELKNDRLAATDFKIINSVNQSPLKDPGSAYSILNKNNRKMFETLRKRQFFFQTVRDFFCKEGFIEINSPTLVESPGIESYIEPFETKYYGYEGEAITYYLPTSPEFALKEALSGGLEKIFEIAKVFRNSGENSATHHPDFFMLEWYRAYEGYESIMNDCRKLINFIDRKIYKKGGILRNGKPCDLTKIKKIRVKDLFKKHGINLDLYSNDSIKFIAVIKDFYEKKGNTFSGTLTKDDWFFKFFLDFIEPELGFDCPVIVCEYPFEMAGLSKKCSDNNYAERFELYISGIEIANAFGELTDPEVQKSNFNITLEFRDKNKAKIKLGMPERFLKSMEYGLPFCSGIALGLERLFMLFEELDTIDDTNLFRF
jgi:elongation factor P--(R)-beta-lysine ligase